MKRKGRASLWRLTLILLTGLTSSSCSKGEQEAPFRFTRQELMQPETCQECHPKHYREWASSMHAYAAEDPVFLAMNRRGQRETDGELGDFCVKCHAPMAVREGATEDGLNLDEVPEHLKGVTCYFCHNATEVNGTHNNPIELADDSIMRGGFRDPVPTSAHGAAYSPLLDGSNSRSADLCGSCHDIELSSGVHLERTFKEWQESVFSTKEGFSTCVGCHMDSTTGIAADDPDVAVNERRIHEHLWPGVDLPLTPFPDEDVQRAAVECALSTLLLVEVCVNQPDEIEVHLEANAGHSFPSGATQDRRAWLELTAFGEGDEIIFETGVIADDEVVDKQPEDPDFDPNLWVMRDHLYDADGDETHLFWEAAPSDAHELGYESSLLPTAVDFFEPHRQSRTFPVSAPPERIEAKVHIRAMGLDVLQDLVDSGDLDASILDRIPTFTLAASQVQWTAAQDQQCAKRSEPSPLDCPKQYRCLLDPEGPGCE